MATQEDEEQETSQSSNGAATLRAMLGGEFVTCTQPNPDRWNNDEGYTVGVTPHHAGKNEVHVRTWSGPSVGPLSADREQRLLQIMKAAKAVHPDNPIMARIAVAQVVQECGWDVSSGLARNDNNFFGIKGTGTDGTRFYDTREVRNGVSGMEKAGFAKNKTPEDSFIQHADLLNRLDRYRGVREARTFEGAANGLVTGGYATDPTYANGLININKRLDGLWAKLDHDNTTSEPKIAGSGRPDVGSLKNKAEVPGVEAKTAQRPASILAGAPT